MRDALAGWLPRAWAEAVAVPLAAQLACTPLVAGLSGQVSLVAVAANNVNATVSTARIALLRRNTRKPWPPSSSETSTCT